MSVSQPTFDSHARTAQRKLCRRLFEEESLLARARTYTDSPRESTPANYLDTSAIPEAFLGHIDEFTHV